MNVSMRSIVCFVISILASTTFAADFDHPSATNCLRSVASFNGWQVLSESQVTCIYKSSHFQSAKKFLCEESGSENSVEFQKFLDFSQQANAIHEEHLNSESTREEMMSMRRLNSLEQEWRIFGFWFEGFASLAMSDQAYESCN